MMVKSKKAAVICLAGVIAGAACGAGDGDGDGDGDGAWRENFSIIAAKGSDKIPPNWRFEGKKLFTPRTAFVISAVIDKSVADGRVLRVEANQSTGVLITMPTADLRKYPILRWRWRVANLPTKADGRTKLDDQAVGIYFGAGGPLSRKSIAYRWETEVPIGHCDKASYGGIVRVKYLCVRNKTSPMNTWIEEEFNAGEAFKKEYGYLPKAGDYVVSVCANSQYTKSHTVAEIDYIELVSKKDALARRLVFDGEERIKIADASIFVTPGAGLREINGVKQ